MQNHANIINEPFDLMSLEPASERLNLGVEELDDIIAPGIGELLGGTGLGAVVGALTVWAGAAGAIVIAT